MPDLKSTDEVLRDSIYSWLGREFKSIDIALTPELRVDLDGKLWKLSQTLANAGLWENLRRMAGLDAQEINRENRRAL